MKKHLCRRLFAALCGLLLFAAPRASARLGEDLAQLRARYGQETSAGTSERGLPKYEFRKGHYTIQATLKDGTCASLVIGLRSNAARKALDLRMAEILIASNTPGVEMPVMKKGPPIIWQDPANTRRAIYFDHPTVPKLFIAMVFPVEKD